VEWIAIGLGVNVHPPEKISGAAWLEPGTSRIDVLTELVPGLRAAAFEPGPLNEGELEEFNARDLARGKACSEPARGQVAGINAAGELLVTIADSVASFRSGSLVLEST
jgi:hypothetical protein